MPVSMHWKEHWCLWGGRDQHEVQGKVSSGSLNLQEGCRVEDGGLEGRSSRAQGHVSLRCRSGAPLLSSLSSGWSDTEHQLFPLWRQSADVGSHFTGASCDFAPSPEVSPRTQKPPGSKIQAGPSPGAVTKPFTTPSVPQMASGGQQML